MKQDCLYESLYDTLNQLIQKTPIHLGTGVVAIFISESIYLLTCFVQNTSSFRTERCDSLYEGVTILPTDSFQKAPFRNQTSGGLYEQVTIYLTDSFKTSNYSGMK